MASTFPRPPQVPTNLGTLDDAIFGADAEANAYGLKTLLENGNLYKSRGARMFGTWADVSAPALETQGAALSHGWPFWHLAVPVIDFPSFKKPGLHQARVATFYEITAGRKVELQITTRRRPFDPDLADARKLVMTGTGSFNEYFKNDLDIHTEGFEFLTFWQRGIVDPDTDPALVEGTFGGKKSGTATAINWAAGLMIDDTTSGSPWNTTGVNQIHKGGHYVQFRSSLDNRIVWPPATITDVFRESFGAGEGFFFWPVPEETVGMPITGLDYDIFQLPAVRMGSIVVYARQLTP